MESEHKCKVGFVSVLEGKNLRTDLAGKYLRDELGFEFPLMIAIP